MKSCDLDIFRVVINISDLEQPGLGASRRDIENRPFSGPRTGSSNDSKEPQATAREVSQMSWNHSQDDVSGAIKSSPLKCLFSEICQSVFDYKTTWIIHVRCHTHPLRTQLPETFWPQSWKCTFPACKEPSIVDSDGYHLWHVKLGHIANHLEAGERFDMLEEDPDYVRIYSALGLLSPEKRISVQLCDYAGAESGRDSSDITEGDIDSKPKVGKSKLSDKKLSSTQPATSSSHSMPGNPSMKIVDRMFKTATADGIARIYELEEIDDLEVELRHNHIVVSRKSGRSILGSRGLSSTVEFPIEDPDGGLAELVGRRSFESRMTLEQDTGPRDHTRIHHMRPDPHGIEPISLSAAPRSIGPKFIRTSGLFSWSLPEQYAASAEFGQPNLGNIMIILNHGEDAYSAITFRQFLTEYLAREVILNDYDTFGNCKFTIKELKKDSLEFLQEFSEDFLEFLNRLCDAFYSKGPSFESHNLSFSFTYWLSLRPSVKLQGKVSSDYISFWTTSKHRDTCDVQMSLAILMDTVIEVLKSAKQGEIISLTLKWKSMNGQNSALYRDCFDSPGSRLGAMRKPFTEHGETYCWKDLLNGASIINGFDMPWLLLGWNNGMLQPVGTHVNGTQLQKDDEILDGTGFQKSQITPIKGLYISFKNLVKLAAVDTLLIYDGGIVLMGYDTLLVPLTPLEGQLITITRWHLIYKPGRQITCEIVDDINDRLLVKKLGDVSSVAVVGWTPKQKYP